MAEEDIICKWDDPKVFAEFYRTYSPQIRRYFALRNGRHDLDGLVQEVFVRFWQQPGQFRGEAAVGTYLIGIAKRVLKQADQKSLPVLAGDSDILDQIAVEPFNAESETKRQKSLRLLPELLAELSPEHRQAVELLVIQGKVFSEAARIMGCTIDAARKRLDRGLKTLRKRLTQTTRSSKLDIFVKLNFL